MDILIKENNDLFYNVRIYFFKTNRQLFYLQVLECLRIALFEKHEIFTFSGKFRCDEGTQVHDRYL